MSESPSSAAPAPPCGFACFCEKTRQYVGGVRAWLFFGPYLLGAIWLEPAPGSESVYGFSPWLMLVAYLLIFPPVWRSFLLVTGLWRKGTSQPSPSSITET